MSMPEFTSGQSVKITSLGERFWVTFGYKLPSVDTNIYCGLVDNHLLTHPYKVGDLIFFTEDQVVDWQ